MKCSHLSNVLSNLLLRNKGMILVSVAVTFIFFTRQKLHSTSSISERRLRTLQTTKMLRRLGARNLQGKTLEANFVVGKGGRLRKGFRVETLVMHAKYIFIKMDRQKYQIGTGRLFLLLSLGLSSVPGY